MNNIKLIMKRALVIVTLLLFSIFSATGIMSKRSFAQAAESYSLSETSITIGMNYPYQIVINHYYNNGSCTFKSSDSAIAKVEGYDGYGYITGVKKGTAKVTVSVTVKGVTTKVGTISVTVSAAKFIDKEMTVGLNSVAHVPCQYLNNSAAYQYKSSDTKVVSVDKYGDATGKKLGKAKITVTETYKGKTTKIGTIAVTVVNATLPKEQEVGITYVTRIAIENKNKKADYDYTSADPSIAQVDDKGYVTGMKAGKVKIYVTEKYKNKTRDLGCMMMNVVNATIYPGKESIIIGINSVELFYNKVILNNPVGIATYTCESSDESVVWAGYETNASGINQFYLKGVGYGETTLTVYEELNGIKRQVGTVDVTVQDIPVINIRFWHLDSESHSSVDSKGNLTQTFYIGYEDDYNHIRSLLNVDPSDTTTPFTYKSSNEKVITIDQNGYITAVSEGTATITVTCGDVSISFKAVVQKML